MVAQTPGCMARRAEMIASTLAFLFACSDSVMLARTAMSLWQQLLQGMVRDVWRMHCLET